MKKLIRKIALWITYWTAEQQQQEADYRTLHSGAVTTRPPKVIYVSYTEVKAARLL